MGRTFLPANPSRAYTQASRRRKRHAASPFFVRKCVASGPAVNAEANEMTHILRSLVLAALMILGVTLAAKAQNSPVVRVPSQDAEMAEAIAKARATLAQFWDKVAKPG